MLGPLHRLSHRTRMIIGFVSAVPVGIGIAEVSNHFKWPDDTTMFAAVVVLLVFCLTLLPFMMGPFDRLPRLPEGERRERGSLWRLLPGGLFPLVWAVAYLLLRPHADHWASAADWAMYVTMGYLLVTNFIFLRTPRKKPLASAPAADGPALSPNDPTIHPADTSDKEPRD